MNEEQVDLQLERLEKEFKHTLNEGERAKWKLKLRFFSEADISQIIDNLLEDPDILKFPTFRKLEGFLKKVKTIRHTLVLRPEMRFKTMEGGTMVELFVCYKCRDSGWRNAILKTDHSGYEIISDDQLLWDREKERALRQSKRLFSIPCRECDYGRSIARGLFPIKGALVNVK